MLPLHTSLNLTICSISLCMNCRILCLHLCHSPLLENVALQIDVKLTLWEGTGNQIFLVKIFEQNLDVQDTTKSYRLVDWAWNRASKDKMSLIQVWKGWKNALWEPANSSWATRIWLRLTGRVPFMPRLWFLLSDWYWRQDDRGQEPTTVIMSPSPDTANTNSTLSFINFLYEMYGFQLQSLHGCCWCQGIACGT